MQTLIFRFILVLSLLGVITAVGVAVAPLQMLFKFIPQAQVLPIGNASLIRGDVLINTPQGGQTFSWSWCPRRGVLSQCVNTAGAWGFGEGLLSLGWSGARLQRFDVSSFNLSALLGLADAQWRATGFITDAHMAWQAVGSRGCPAAAVLVMNGHLQVQVAQQLTLTVDLYPDENHGLRLQGAGLGGRLSEGDGVLQGEISLLGNGTQSAMDIPLRWPCGL